MEQEHVRARHEDSHQRSDMAAIVAATVDHDASRDNMAHRGRKTIDEMMISSSLAPSPPSFTAMDRLPHRVPPLSYGGRDCKLKFTLLHSCCYRVRRQPAPLLQPCSTTEGLPHRNNKRSQKWRKEEKERGRIEEEDYMFH
ncbi:Os09g0571666 [Oryza sativa Japonica Group]|uniref:Os09g0571666 protein n=2 Tax=Oryza sativa subsp. japonica TaxID=39947 RepID=Q651A6_ORYSJ|nr:hypothetical protein [Oryza sativa Japonica Group]BAT09529.1 Os09g0571666 [Oryza sativa Japonica Group]